MFVCLCLQSLAECRQVTEELQETQAGLSSRLEQQKQQLSDVSAINYAFDSERISLQDGKERVSGRSSDVRPVPRLESVCLVTRVIKESGSSLLTKTKELLAATLLGKVFNCVSTPLAHQSIRWQQHLDRQTL